MMMGEGSVRYLDQIERAWFIMFLQPQSRRVFND